MKVKFIRESEITEFEEAINQALKMIEQNKGVIRDIKVHGTDFDTQALIMWDNE
jgi:hypothetical protein